jgi:hypothetical protein
MRLKFSDGMDFDCSGKYRVIHRSDGYYVIGKGMLFPVDSKSEGEEEVARLNKDVLDEIDEKIAFKGKTIKQLLKEK